MKPPGVDQMNFWITPFFERDFKIVGRRCDPEAT